MSRVTTPTIRFTVDEYYRMAEAGVLGRRRTELINGRIRKMAPQLDPHVFVISKTNRTLSRIFSDDEMLVVQGTINLDRYTSVDPDFMWFNVPLGTPEYDRPLPLLLIEVSNTTYRKDSGIKLRKYAKAGISDYWIINIPHGRIEVYQDPSNPTGRAPDWRYGTVRHFVRGERITLKNRPEVTLGVDDLLV